MAKPPTRLIDIKEAADRLRISERQIYRIIGDGHIPVVYIGTAVRIRESAIEDFIVSLERNPFRHRRRARSSNGV